MTVLPLSSMLTYAFMQRAFIVGLLLALIIPCIGTVTVLRRLSMIGDALSHVSLAGVAAGLVAGVNPVVGSIIACVVAGFSVDWIRRRIPHYSEISIAIVLSVGVGLAGVLSGFVKNAADFNSFLFGSIVAISDFELRLVVVVSLAVMLVFGILYRQLMSLAFDEQLARLSGVSVNVINVIFTVLTALTVAVAARTVGALIVSSMLVVPVAAGMQTGRSYRQTVIWSTVYAVLSTVVGLTTAYLFGLKPGGTMVLSAVALLIVVFAVERARARLGRRKAMGEGRDDPLRHHHESPGEPCVACVHLTEDAEEGACDPCLQWVDASLSEEAAGYHSPGGHADGEDTCAAAPRGDEADDGQATPPASR